MPASPFPAPTPPALVGGQKYCPTCFGLRSITVAGAEHTCPTCKGAGKRGASATGPSAAVAFISMADPVTEGATAILTGAGLSVAAVGANPAVLWGPALFATVGTRIGDTSVSVTVPNHTQVGVALGAPFLVVMETTTGALLACGNTTSLAAAPAEVISSVVGDAPGGANVIAANTHAVITGTGFVSIGGGVVSCDVGGEACGINGGTVTDTNIDIFGNATPIGASVLTVHFTNGDTATFPGVSIV